MEAELFEQLCESVKQAGEIRRHWSDCSVHNEPAYPAGPCDCGGIGDKHDPSIDIYAIG